MQWLLNNYRDNPHRYHVGIILLLTLCRVFFTGIRECPPGFDCNSYISMVDRWLYDPDIVGHHAMRILPSIIVKGLTAIGLTKTQSFYFLSGLSFVGFGLLLYYFFSIQRLAPALGMALTLLALSAHEALKIPLQLVYQTCDAWVYPMTLFMFICSIRGQVTPLFALSIIGIFIRQNLFVMGLFSLLYCIFKQQRLKGLIYLACLIFVYACLQNYYQANETFERLLMPPKGYFDIGHLSWVVWDSQLLALVLPIMPFLIIHARLIFMWFLRYWHLGLYMCITAGQPFLAYHMTGNNFPRLALQGLWVLYLALGCVWLKPLQRPWMLGALSIYALSVYFTWGIKQRVIMMGIVTLIMLFCYIWWLYQATRLRHQQAIRV